MNVRAEKSQFVQFWLEEFYGEGKAPDYEVNDSTLSYLYDLAVVSRQKEKSTKILLDSLDSEIENYKKKALLNEEILCVLNLSHNTLDYEEVAIDNPNLKKVLQLKDKFADLSSILKTTLDLGGILNSIISIEDEKNHIIQKRSLLESRRLKLKRQFQDILEYKNILKKTEVLWNEQIGVQKTQTVDRMENLIYFEGKSTEYTNSLKNLKEKLRKAGTNPLIYHSYLSELNDQLLKLETENHEKQNQLEIFNKLPPDPVLAKLKIQELREKLDELEKDFSQKLSDLKLESIA